MKVLYEQNKKLDPNDIDGVLAMFEKEKTVLCANLEDTIAYLRKATPDELYYVCEVWDDISYYWKSERLIEVMQECTNRCEGEVKESLEMSLFYAKRAMKL